MIKSRKRQNIINYTSSREINVRIEIYLFLFHRIKMINFVFTILQEEICGVLQKRLHVTDKLIDRLGLELELEGHDGCVNCLEWSETGRLNYCIN